MEKLTNNRTYLDYNATSPFSKSVLNWLQKGDLFFANPSSIHSQGKNIRRKIEDVRDFLYDTFSLNENLYHLFFHSGATEGINSILKGFAESHEKICLIYAVSDHSCIESLKPWFEKHAHRVVVFDVNVHGEFDQDALKKLIKKNSDLPVLVNYTWVNNESGVHWPLEKIREVKMQTDCFVHVDAVQSVGKIENWQMLDSSLDAYSYSAHKFGSLKGVGFSFVKRNFPFTPLIVGGAQQENYRSGTENTLGIQSIELALRELKDNQNIETLRAAKEDFEKKLNNDLQGMGEIAGFKARYRNANTVYFILQDVKSDVSSVAFDMGGMDVSTGSACSSGAILPSRVLMSMGYNETLSKSAIRLSFSPYLNRAEGDEIYSRVQRIIQRFR